jgi:hypothetical protein
MRRLVLLAAMILAAGSALQTALAQGADQHASLENFGCHPAVKSAKRFVSVTALMRPMAGTVRLGLRFELLGTKSGLLTSLRGGDLGTWISPNPATLGQQPGDVWILKHAVTGVPSGSTYRFRVSFRWSGANGRVIATATRSTVTCWQPFARADLLVRSIDVILGPGDPSQNQYVVSIANAGLTAVGSFQVVFAPGGGAGARQTVTVPRLGPQKGMTETFTGPACTAPTAPTVTVDPGHEVDDANRANNSMTAICPVTGPPGAS